MEIYTPTPDRHKEGDSIVVESYEQSNDVIYVGIIRNIEENTLTTSIPLESVQDMWDLVSNKDTRSDWEVRFEKSQYQMYMKAEVNDSGNISISGV